MDDGAPLEWELRAQQQARRGLAWERARKRLLIVAVVVAVVVAVGGTVWALQSSSARDRLPPRAERRSQVPFTIATPVHLGCRAPLTSDDPLRLWIAGDSLAGSLGPELGDLAAATGVVAPTFDTRPSSGLTSPGFFDWPAHAREEVERVDPEVVVFIIGANDSDVADDGTLDAHGKPAWKTRYALLVQQMLEILGDGRSVIWIGSPTLRDGHKNEGVRQLDEVARTVVSNRVRSTYVDAYRLFADEHGDYTPTLTGLDGHTVRVRTSDGVHFNSAGGRYLAAVVLDLLDRQCDIREQADPLHPQEIRESPGSGGPTGDGSGGGDGGGADTTGGSGSGGGSTVTSPPTAAPPPTSPPPTDPQPLVTVPTLALSRMPVRARH